MKWRLVFFAIICTLLSFEFFSLWSIGLKPIKKQDISIPAGASFDDLNKIFALDIPRYQFILYRKLFAENINLKAGTYRVGSDMTFSEVLIWPLKKPFTTDKTIMILPGWNLFDIEQMLQKAGITDIKKIFDNPNTGHSQLVTEYPFLASTTSFEGFIYPDTYRVKQTADANDVLRVAIANFNTKIYSKLSSESKRKMHTTLILASIVEKEERNVAEKPRIAGVLTNRLKTKMSLGADATVCYALKMATSECTPSDIVSWLDSLSPYNTRKFTWLPPTPIASLSRESWLAADSPEKTTALYYLHDGDGEIHYADSLEEHNANKRKYLGR